MIKFCTNCGKELTSERFCVNCGHDSWSDFTSKEPISRPVVENLQPVINSPGTRTFSYTSLIFGLIPLIILIMVFVPIPGVEFIADLISYSAIPLFAFGLFQFVKELPIQMQSEGKFVINILVFYSIISIIYDFVMVNFIPEIPENASLETLQSIIIILIVMIALGIAIETIMLLGSLKFTTWFNNLLIQLRIPGSTTRLKWFALIGLISMGFMFIAMLIILYSLSIHSQDIFESSYLFLGISSLLVLVQIIMQFLAGYKIYKLVTSPTIW